MTVLSRLRQRLPDQRTCVLLGLCLAVALVLDFLYYTGFFASDDMAYLKAARQLANLGTETDNFGWSGSIATTRLGVTIPDGFVYWLCDGSVATIAWFHVGYHLALVVLAYAIGREVWDARVGLLAAALVATSPALYLFAGAVLPDNATAVWLAVLLLLLLRARRRASERPLTWREAARRYAIAGLVLGLAYSCKETAIIMTVPCAAVIMAGAPSLRSRVWVRDGAFLAGGLVAFILFEAVLLRLLTEEWIWRLGGVEGSGEIFEERMTTQGTGPFARIGYLVSLLRAVMPLSGALLLISALVFPFLRRRDPALLAFCWWPLLYLTLGSTSFSAYLPSSIQERYYAIVILPAAVMAAIVLRVAVERWAGRGWATRGLVVALVALAVFEARSDLYFGGTAYRAEHVRGFTLAYETTRARYPGYPILLSRTYRRRMTPVLFPHDPDPRPTTTPFIVLSPLAEALPEGQTKIEGVRIKRMYVRTVDIIYPPRRRADVLLDDARAMLGTSPRPPVPNSHQGAAAIQLVTLSTGEDPPPYQRLPLIPLSGTVSVTSIDGGNHATWTGRAKFLLQLFDPRAKDAAPAHAAAQLAEPAARARVELDLTLSRSVGARIRVAALGYDADGARLDFEQVLDLDPAASSAVASLELAGPTPFVAVRLRVSVHPRGDSGVLYVGNPRITPLP